MEVRRVGHQDLAAERPPRARWLQINVHRTTALAQANKRTRKAQLAEDRAHLIVEGTFGGAKTAVVVRIRARRSLVLAWKGRRTWQASVVALRSTCAAVGGAAHQQCGRKTGRRALRRPGRSCAGRTRASRCRPWQPQHWKESQSESRRHAASVRHSRIPRVGSATPAAGARVRLAVAQ